MNKISTIITWLARILAALILLQTLYFKFSGAEESKYIFSRLGAEPWGRIGSGVVELIASVLILIPATTKWGAVLGLGVISGAILSHLTVLGISVKNSDGTDDGGQLFIYACIVFVCCLYLVWINRKQLPILKKF
ncbi:MAG: DoxX family protein [Bacteroidetes bacterium]|nr:DoxX family protein [Bacteroidota bacterium]